MEPRPCCEDGRINADPEPGRQAQGQRQGAAEEGARSGPAARQPARLPRRAVRARKSEREFFVIQFHLFHFFTMAHARNYSLNSSVHSLNHLPNYDLQPTNPPNHILILHVP